MLEWRERGQKWIKKVRLSSHLDCISNIIPHRHHCEGISCLNFGQIIFALLSHSRCMLLPSCHTQERHTQLCREAKKKVAAAEEKTFSAAGVVAAAAAIVCWDSEKKMLSVLLLSWIFPTELFLLFPPSSSPSHWTCTKMCGWKAFKYFRKLSRFRFSPSSTPPATSLGWHPWNSHTV